jgi:transposase-like protein
MDPTQVFCHNAACPARGQVGQGTITIHSQHDQRYQCKVCHKTFVARTGTPFYRLHKSEDLFIIVISLLSHGCPTQAIVAAYGLDEATVARWAQEAGQHAHAVHEQIIQQGQVDLGHVQADELYVKLVGAKVWMAMAMAVPSRLWLGGVVSVQRDFAFIAALVAQVRACALTLAILVCVDGLASYVRAFRDGFRTPERTGKRGRPRLLAEAGLRLGQMIKHRRERRVVEVTRRAALGTEDAIAATLQQTGTGTVIHTAYIERLNATFRASLTALVRRGRAILHQTTTLETGMWLVGCAYNFCWVHASLREAVPPGGKRRWRERTPAMAAGLTDHVWTMSELLHYQIPLAPWVPPTRRGRPPKPKPTPIQAMAA